MRVNQISGVTNNKPELLEKVEQALRTGNVPWSALIDFLDEREPNGKQRVLMLAAAPADANSTYSPTNLQIALTAAGQGDRWNAKVPLAAPRELTLSSVMEEGGVITIVAIGQRSYTVRDEGLEAQVTPPAPNTEVRVYKTETIRGWVRAEFSTTTGALNIRVVALPNQKTHQALAEAFGELIDPWFPLGSFSQLNLHKAIEELYDGERNGPPHDARVQAVVLHDSSGLRTSIRGADASQSVIGQADNLQDAYDVVRERGSGSGGNLLFLSAGDGGPRNSPVGDEPVRAVINAQAGRVDFTTPHTKEEIAHVLDRIRVLAT